jgi:hypothetical protein
MQFRDVTAVYCEHDTEYINTARWQNAEISNAKAMLLCFNGLNSDKRCCYAVSVEANARVTGSISS